MVDAAMLYWVVHLHSDVLSHMFTCQLCANVCCGLGNADSGHHACAMNRRAQVCTCNLLASHMTSSLAATAVYLESGIYATWYSSVTSVVWYAYFTGAPESVVVTDDTCEDGETRVTGLHAQLASYAACNKSATFSKLAPSVRHERGQDRWKVPLNKSTLTWPHLDVAQRLRRAEGDLHREEGARIGRRHHEFSGAAAVGGVDQIDAPHQLAVPRVVPPVAVDLDPWMGISSHAPA